jgi:hypothetical protein
MSWRVLFVFVVSVMAISAAAGVALGNWLVDQAPGLTTDARTNTGATPEPVLDAAGRPFAGLAPQPLSNGGLGVPQPSVQPMWEIQAVSLFDTNLDPMVVLAIGDESFSVSDMLGRAGEGLAQGPGDIATVDVTSPAVAVAQPNATPQAVASTAPARLSDWQDQLAEALKACQSVGFFSRPNCIDRARKKYCEPNGAWGQHPLCPTPTHTQG